MEELTPPDLVTEALIHYRNLVEAKKAKEEHPQPPHVITIARDYGSGGSVIARMIGEKLGYHVWDQDILDLLACQGHSHYESEAFKLLDERGRGALGALVASFLRSADEETYHLLLRRAIETIAQRDAVIVGRGGYLLLPKAFHVLVKASLETRMKRVAERNKTTLQEAKKLIEKVDRERKLFIKQLASHLEIPLYKLKVPFDLELTTDRLSYEDAAHLILEGASVFFKNLETSKHPK